MIATTPFFADRGCSIRVLDSYLRLKNDDNDIELLTYNLGRDINGLKIKRILKVPFYKNTDPGFNFFKPFADFLILIETIKLCKKYKFDYIYAHTFEAALIGLLSKKIFDLPVTFDAQGSLVGELVSHKTIKEKSFLAFILEKIEKYIVLRSDEIITSTEGLKDFFLSKFNRTKNIHAIKDYPNKTLFNPSVKKIKLNIKILSICLFVLSSCSDVLDKVPLNSYSDGTVWADINLSDYYLNFCYRSCLNFRAMTLSGVSDECMFIHIKGIMFPRQWIMP